MRVEKRNAANGNTYYNYCFTVKNLCGIAGVENPRAGLTALHVQMTRTKPVLNLRAVKNFLIKCIFVIGLKRKTEK